MYDTKFNTNNSQSSKPKMPKMPVIKKGFWQVLLGLVILGILILSGVHVVPAGNIGVVTQFGAAKRLANPGIGLHIPFVETVVLMSTRTQKDEVPASAMSKDLQVATSSVAINYHLDGSKALSVFQDLGINYADVIIAPALQNTFKATTAQFSAEQLITHREEVRVKSEEVLKEELAKYNIIVENFNIVNFEFSPEFQAAIERKQVAQQEVETAKQRLNQAQIDAQATVAQAQGQADAQKALKDTGALSPEYLQYLFLTKWDGILPQVMTSGTDSMIDVSKFMETTTQTTDQNK